MKRILLTVEYDGTAYAGWQRQINGLAVQQVLEEALSSACGHPVSVTGASLSGTGICQWVFRRRALPWRAFQIR